MTAEKPSVFREADNKRETLRKRAKHGKLIHQMLWSFYDDKIIIIYFAKI